MSFKRLNIDIVIAGALLSIIHTIFPERIPSLSEYAQEKGVSCSTFARSAKWLEKLLRDLFRNRRPGPSNEKKKDLDDKQDNALSKLKALRIYMAKTRKETTKNDCYNGETKKRIAGLAEKTAACGELNYGEIAKALNIGERQLRRIRKDVRCAGGESPKEKSRRPKHTKSLARQIQILIADIKNSASTKRPYGPIDVKRILEKNYKEILLKYHDKTTIALDTVSKYMNSKKKKDLDHPRGSYVYPEPFQQVAIDTSYFKLFARTYYVITMLEMGGRLNLITKVFLQDNTESVVTVLEEYLAKYPGVEVVVIDRGTPYLNEEVKILLESHGRFRIVCPTKTPTAKAAAERHFRTLKEALRPAVNTVLLQDPGWTPEVMIKALEMSISVFMTMYHQIPQEGIDGKSPAERIVEFNLVRACAQQMDLFQRSLDSQPGEEYAVHIHKLFQLEEDEKDTVKKLGKFSTRILRKLVDQEKKVMGPPLAGGIITPLDYLTARAWELKNKEKETFYAKEWKEADAKRERQKRLAEETKKREKPEEYIDSMLATLVKSVKMNLGIGISTKYMLEIFKSLSKKMGSFFPSEFSRLKSLLNNLCDNPKVKQATEQILDNLFAKLYPVVEVKA